MFKKRICALALCAVMTVGAAVPAGAEVYSASVVQELGATTKAVEWNGKTALKAGKSYVVSKNVTVSKKITIPSGTTVTVKNGAKLWVSSKGKLLIKGTLTVNKGATLAVTGTLYEYKAKKLNVSGAMNFGTKSKITLNGNVTVKSTGTVKGTPKAISVGQYAAVTVKGKNSSEKFAKAIEIGAVEKVIGTFFTKSICRSDLYGAMTAVYPADYIKKLDEMFVAAGSSLKDYCKLQAENMKADAKDDVFGEFYGDKTANVEVSVTKTTDITKSLTAEQKAVAKEICGGADKAYSVEAVLSVGMVDDKVTIAVIEKDGKWYLLG